MPLPAMKTSIQILISLAFTLTSRAQAAIDWLSLDAAGSTSVGGIYTVGATLGQPDAVQSTSASYTIIGGFWAAESLTPGGGVPELHITLLSPSEVKLWWSSPATGFELQFNNDVGTPGTWANVSGAVADDGFTRNIQVPTTPNPRFYRLRKN